MHHKPVLSNFFSRVDPYHMSWIDPLPLFDVSGGGLSLCQKPVAANFFSSTWLGLTLPLLDVNGGGASLCFKPVAATIIG